MFTAGRSLPRFLAAVLAFPSALLGQNQPPESLDEALAASPQRILSIPIASLDPEWDRALALTRETIATQPADYAALLERPGFAYEHEGDFDSDGLHDKALVGVYRTKAGEVGGFLLIATEQSPGRWEKAFLAKHPKNLGFTVLHWNGEYFTWIVCTHCDVWAVVDATEAYRIEWISPSEPDAAEWDGVARFRVPEVVAEMLDQRCHAKEDKPPASSACRVQVLEDSDYPGFHRDHFSVLIGQQPRINGREASPEELLSYIRRNLGAFVDTSVVVFEPLDSSSREVWESEEPLGALLHVTIKLGGEGAMDGAVLVSKASPDHLMLTTLWTARFGYHPFHGNREVGIATRADGSAVLFTKALLRASSQRASDDLRPLYRAIENAWGSFQHRVIEFVNENGGEARRGTVSYGQGTWDLYQRLYADSTQTR